MGCNVSKDVKVEDQHRTEGDGQDDANRVQKGSCEVRTTNQRQDKAATKIQASFRGYKARKETTKMKSAPAPQENSEEDIDLTDPDLSKAATKIQASFRGHKVRKDMMGTCPSDPAGCTSKNDEEGEMLMDSDMEKAATKIQATFRGYKVRKTKDTE